MEYFTFLTPSRIKIMTNKSHLSYLNINDVWLIIKDKTFHYVRISKKEMNKIKTIIDNTKDYINTNTNTNTNTNDLKEKKEDIIEQIELIIQTHMHDKYVPSYLNQEEESNEIGEWWIKWLFQCFEINILPYIHSKKYTSKQFFRLFKHYLYRLSTEEQQTLFYITETILGGESLNLISSQFNDWILKNTYRPPIYLRL